MIRDFSSLRAKTRFLMYVCNVWKALFNIGILLFKHHIHTLKLYYLTKYLVPKWERGREIKKDFLHCTINDIHNMEGIKKNTHTKKDGCNKENKIIYKVFIWASSRSISSHVLFHLLYFWCWPNWKQEFLLHPNGIHHGLWLVFTTRVWTYSILQPHTQFKKLVGLNIF
jgi:hypothetical protein